MALPKAPAAAVLAALAGGLGVLLLRRSYLNRSGDDDDCARAVRADMERREDESRKRCKRRSVTIYLIRHAQTESNKDKSHCHNGRHVNVALTETGRQQAAALGRRLANLGVQFSEVYASEATRTHDTAAICCKELAGDHEIRAIDTRFNEQGYAEMGICEIAMGAWTGKDKNDCATAEVNAARESDAWEWKPPGLSHDEQLEGESYRDVEERFLAFLEDHTSPSIRFHRNDGPNAMFLVPHPRTRRMIAPSGGRRLIEVLEAQNREQCPPKNGEVFHAL